MAEVKFEYYPAMEAAVRKVMAGEYGVPLAKPDPFILDLGGNIGSFAVWAKSIWPAATVHSFEPVPFNCEVFRRNTAGLEGVTLHEMAVGDPDLNKIWVGKNNQGECSQYQSISTTDEWMDIEVCDPDSNWFQDLARKADFIKLDIEGAEPYVLFGIPLTAKFICLEYHSEQDRRAIDGVLRDYRLIGAEVTALEHGLLKYEKIKR